MTLLGASCRARAARRGRHGAPGATARSSCGAPEARVSAPAPSCSSLVLDRYILLASPRAAEEETESPPSVYRACEPPCIIIYEPCGESPGGRNGDGRECDDAGEHLGRHTFAAATGARAASCPPTATSARPAASAAATL